MNSFRWFLAVASLVVLALGLPPANAQDNKARLSKEDATSLSRMAQGDMAGEQMVQEQGKMLEEGRKLAQAKS